MENSIVIQQTIKWIENVVVGCNFCPFAASALKHKTVKYVVLSDVNMKVSFKTLLEECVYLDAHSETETTFIIFDTNYVDFNNYLNMLEKANKLLHKNDYSDLYQLASFHPLYCFAGASMSDAANYTNRSPYPMLHLLREASITQALKYYKNPENIPEHNIAYAENKGLAYMQLLLAACIK